MPSGYTGLFLSAFQASDDGATWTDPCDVTGLDALFWWCGDFPRTVATTRHFRATATVPASFAGLFNSGGVVRGAGHVTGGLWQQQAARVVDSATWDGVALAASVAGSPAPPAGVVDYVGDLPAAGDTAPPYEVLVRLPVPSALLAAGEHLLVWRVAAYDTGAGIAGHTYRPQPAALVTWRRRGGGFHPG